MELLKKHENYFPSGKIKSKWETLNGKIHGEYIRYLSNGKVIKRILYNDGVMEKVIDCETDTVYTADDFIKKLYTFSQEGIESRIRAFSTSYFFEIIDIPNVDESMNFKGKLMFKCWGKNSSLWLVFLIDKLRLIKIPVYKNKLDIYTYTGKECNLDFSAEDTWLKNFEIEIMKASSGRFYLKKAKEIK